MALEHEIQVYRLHLIDMLGVDDINEGKFTVIKGDDIQGPFNSYEEALQFGYNKHGLVPFLVKKIERNESVLYFSRPLSRGRAYHENDLRADRTARAIL